MQDGRLKLTDRLETISKPWQTQLKIKLTFFDLISLLIAISLVFSIRFPEIWRGELNSYEARNLVIAFVVLLGWLFFLWLNGSRDVKILGF